MFKKGDRILVTGDSILNGVMGLGTTVSGTVFLVGPDGRIIGFKCDQTGAMECVSDGDVSLA